MRFPVLVSFIVFFLATANGSNRAGAQSYADSIKAFRDNYVRELLEDERAPIKKKDVSKLSFFTPNEKYRVWADVRETPGSTPFMIPTHSGKNKPYRVYAVLTFMIDGERYGLRVYQGIDLMKNDKYKDYLFLPFNDQTNYNTTYGGGRYIDLSIVDIRDHKILLDFNKAYNPYCAYADGFNCPIPPSENRMPIEIPAGEKTFPH
ncbi:MAG: DUF1684 domain-containing protein [Taibaiella sp.]|nr:DUF1684 domain-containing protein [Taibaiella sp.]